MNSTEAPQVYVVLLAVNACSSPSRICEQTEGEILGDMDEREIPAAFCNLPNLAEKVNENCVLAYRLTDFMDAMNSEDIDIGDYFMTYVYARYQRNKMVLTAPETNEIMVSVDPNQIQ